jgi:hypothetical protein
MPAGRWSGAGPGLHLDATRRRASQGHARILRCVRRWIRVVAVLAGFARRGSTLTDADGGTRAPSSGRRTPAAWPGAAGGDSCILD